MAGLVSGVRKARRHVHRGEQPQNLPLLARDAARTCR